MKIPQINISLVLLILLFASFTHQQTVRISGNTTCDTGAASPLIQTGTYSLTRQSNVASRLTTFQVNVNYPIPSTGLTVTVSTGRINGYSQAVGTDYSIRASRFNQTSVNFVLFINNDISWASIQTSFIFSSRSDLIVGSFYPNTQSLFVPGTNTLVAQHQIPNWTPFSGNVNFALLISGLKTADTFFNVNLTQANFVSQTGLFSIQVYTDASPSLEMISISYVLVLSSAPFSFTRYSPLTATPSSTYTFEGVNSFFGNNIGYEGYAINFLGTSQLSIPCFGSNCPSTCVAPTRCTSLNGVISFNQCFLCGFEEVFSSNLCVPRCTGNETWSGTSCVCRTGYTRVNGVCRIINCGANQSFNGIECICLPGFQRINSVCRNITCPRNEVFNGTDCVCLQGYQRINNFCQIIQCPTNSFWNGQECTCNQGFIRIGVSCFLQCAQNAYLNETGSCVCQSGFVRNSLGQCVSSSSIICGSNEVFDSVLGKCVCRAGTFFSRNQCLPRCANFDNAVIFQGVCVCIEGFEVVNGFCVRQPICTKENEVLVNGNCTCRSGFQYNSLGLCIANCQTNQVLVLEACQCVSGFVRNSFGVCVRACSDNQVLVGGICRCASGFVRLFNGTCTRSCPVNQFNSNGNCVCISTFSRNSQGVCTKTCGLNEVLQGTDCVCAPGWARNSTTGFCSILVPVCRENEFLNGTQCQCIPGYTRQGLICVSICRVNEVYDTTIQGCICIQGYGLSPLTRLCEVCPANSRSTGLLSGCVCITGYRWNNTIQRCEVIICQANASLSSSGECVCNSGFYLDGQECKRTVACPTRSTWDPTRLVCVCTVTGEFLINGTCQTCPANSAWNGTQCTCRTGFFPIAGSCVQCSSNSRFIQGQCVCNFGFFGNGLTCSACHSTCGTCSGSLSTNCLTCANASYAFSSFVCTLRQCNSGNYFNTTIQQCKKCVEYCASCSSDNNCDTCITGFEVLPISIGLKMVQECGQICGDGRKFYLDCDDGNLVNGDGCNADCKVENGWTCVGGNTTNKSSCSNVLPTGTKIITNGHVVLQGKVLQGMSMTYLPANLLANGCPQCNNILNVSVISTPIIPIVSVSYIQATQFKFVITFDFNNILGIFVFNFTVRINSNLASFFTQADMDQVQVVRIDMALLSAVDTAITLSLSNLQTNDPIVQTTSKKNTTSIVIPGVPQQAVLIMFGPDQ